MSQPTIVLLLLCGYVIVWLTVSFFSSRNSDGRSFFDGGRKIPWPVVAIAMIGAPITGVTFISVPGMVMGKSMSYIQMGLGFIVGYFIISLILIPIYYKQNIISVYSYLQNRFGETSYKTGAWLFFVSKIIGISIRFLMACAILQMLVFDPLGIPFAFSVATCLLLIWISTYKGGVKSVIWGDVLKSFFLLSTIILILYFIVRNLNLSFDELSSSIINHKFSQIFFFNDPADTKYFWKQFIAGIFIVIAMTGLDQDMMQRSLACKSSKDSQKNLILSTFLQLFIISLLLLLGIIMIIFLEKRGIELPAKSDNLFATVAFHPDIPIVVGILFVLGVISATISSVASALTSLTTTASLDLTKKKVFICEGEKIKRRKLIHGLIAILMALIVMFFYYLNEEDAISTVYRVISYTDGPILGLFLFGIICKREINEKILPVICIAAPLISWCFQWVTMYFFEYQTSFELLIINALITFIGLFLISKKTKEYRVEQAL